MSDWIMKVTGAKMPSSVKSPYSIVRVLEVTTGVADVSSCRANDVIRIVWESAAVPTGGTTARSGYQKNIAYARDLIARRTEIEARDRKLAMERQAMRTAMVAAKLQRGEQITAADLAGIRPL